MTNSVTDAATVTVETVDKLIREIPALTPPPVSELVTVAHGESFHKNVMATVRVDKSRHCNIPLVTRVQAEAREADLLRQLAMQQEEIASLANSLDGSEHCRKDAEAKLETVVGERDRQYEENVSLIAENTRISALWKSDTDHLFAKQKNLEASIKTREAKLAAQGQEPFCWIPTATAKWLEEYDRSACGQKTVAHNRPIKTDGGVPLYTAPQPDRSAVLEEAAKAAEGSSKSFDHQAALADHRDCESGFHGGRVAAARSIRALKEQPTQEGVIEND